MGLKKCDKCEEMVDEAKAFCPGCGNAFVEEEKRQKASEFDKLDSTVQFGQTMYNQMLSDMGLNISKAPDPPPKRIEVIVPAAAAPAPVKPAAKPQTVQNTAPAPASNMKWYIAGGILLILGFLIVAAGAVIAVYFNWDKFR